MPLEVHVAESGGVAHPRPHEIWTDTDEPHGQSATPVVSDEVDRALRLKRLELADEPLDVFLLGRTEALRPRAAEAGQLWGDDVRSRQMGAQRLPDGRRLGDTVNENGGHAVSLSRRH